MIQLWLPMVVTPRSWMVPVLKVQNSRITLWSPISSRVGSPSYFLSCGASPSETKWKIWLCTPIFVWPVITAWAPTVVPAPISTCSPMIV